MGTPGAKRGDRIIATDTHILLVPAPPGPPVPTPTPLPFSGVIDGALSESTFIDDMNAATVDSQASNTPAHVPTVGPFQTPPSDRGTIIAGSSTVFIDEKAAARAGDTAETCNDPSDLPVGVGEASGSVIAG
mgnify:CR=1 FL=1